MEGGGEEQPADAADSSVASLDSPIMLKEPTSVEVGEATAQEDSSAPQPGWENERPPGLSAPTEEPDSAGSRVSDRVAVGAAVAALVSIARPPARWDPTGHRWVYCLGPFPI